MIEENKPFSDMVLDRKADATRVAKAMRTEGIEVRQWSEGRGLNWLRLFAKSDIDAQLNWEKARNWYFANC